MSVPPAPSGCRTCRRTSGPRISAASSRCRTIFASRWRFAITGTSSGCTIPTSATAAVSCSLSCGMRKGDCSTSATKGSGQTPYSRSADGRLTLKGGVREILATEMLEALGVDTSKSFALFETGEQLSRGDEPSPTRSSVLTRLSHGHIRIGTFQRQAFLKDTDALDRLVRYCLEQSLRRSARCRCFGERASPVCARQRRDGKARRELHGSRLRPRRAEQRQHQDHRARASTTGPGASRLTGTAISPPLISTTSASMRSPGSPRRSSGTWHSSPAACRCLPTPPRFPTSLPRGAGDSTQRSSHGFCGGWESRADGESSDRELARALVEALETKAATIDRVFFDWRGGRDPGAELYPAEPFRKLAALLTGREASPERTPIGRNASPARCTSRRSRRSGVRLPIATTGRPFEAKIAAIRRNGRSDAGWTRPRLTPLGSRGGAGRDANHDQLDGTRNRQGNLVGGNAATPPSEVATARAALPGWSHHSIAYRSEALRRFANVVRKREKEFATLISRETGKPFWETQTEVAAVINKVDISINAHSDRTPKRTSEAAMGSKVSVRHKPHGVLAVLGPYNFPAHLPNGHIVPALIAGNTVVFKPSEKTPASGEFLVQCYRDAGIPEGAVRLLIGGPEQGRALAAQDGHRRASLHRFGACGHGASQAVRRDAAEDPGAGAWRQQSAGRLAPQGPRGSGGNCRSVGFPQRRAAVHLRSKADRRGRTGKAASRRDCEGHRPDHRRRAVRHSAAVHGPRHRQRHCRPPAGAVGGADDEGRKADPPPRPTLRGPSLSDARVDRRHRLRPTGRTRRFSGRCSR